MPLLSIKVLGFPKVYFGDQTLDCGIKPSLLLALLALGNDQTAFTRDQLALWLWSGKPNPLANLSSALNKLRESLGADAFVGDEKLRTLRLGIDTTCDLLSVMADCQSDQATRWSKAWERWEMPFLGFADPYWDVRLDPQFQEWLLERRESLHLLRRDLASKLATHHLEAQRWVQAQTFLEAVPPEVLDVRETQVFHAMLVCTALGQPEQALRLYQRLSEVLNELNSKPNEDVSTAYAIARQNEIAAARGLLEELYPLGQGVKEMPFVGREMDMQMLISKIPNSFETRAYALLLTGEPGAGKTEFARRLVKRLDPNRKIFLMAESFSEQLAPQWRTFDLIVRQLVRSRRKELEQMPTELRAALARFAPDLLEVNTSSEVNDDERLLFLALRWLLTDADRPTLLFLDDAQWIDPPSLGLVLELLRKPPPRGMLLLLTARDTEGLNSENLPSHLLRLIEMIQREQIGVVHPLEGLDENGIAELTQYLGRTGLNVADLRQQSGGNPLYLLEMLQVQTPKLGLTPRLEAMMRNRIEALPAASQAREVLEAASILGEGAGLAELRAVCNLSFEQTVKALSTLRAARLLRRADTQIAFHHELTRQATRNAMTPQRVQLLHLRAAQVRLNRPELAATHFWAALAEGRETLPEEDMQTVVEIFSQAGTLFAMRGDPEHGHGWFKRSLELAPNATTRVNALTRRARVHERMLEFDSASRDLDQAQVLAGAVDAVTRASILNARGLLFATAFGDAASAERVAREALKQLEGLETPSALSERANALNNLGVAANYRHDLAVAEQHHKSALEIRRALGEVERVAISLQNLGSTLIASYDPAARTYFEEARAIFKQIGNRLGIAYILTNLGLLEWQLGALDKAEHCFEEALEAGKPWGEDFNSDTIYNNLGAIRFFQGKYLAARTAYSIALGSKHVVNHLLKRAILHNNLAEAELRLGRFNEVRTNLENAFELFKSAPNAAYQANCHWFQGELEVLTGKPLAAHQSYLQAVELAQKSKQSEREAESLARLAQLNQDQILAEQAIRILDTPLTRSAKTAASGAFTQALEGLLVTNDLYEQLRLATDAAYITQEASWLERAKILLEQIRHQGLDTVQA